MSKQPKITILPSVEQDVFFQEIQFDSELPGRGGVEGMTNGGNRGTNPTLYYQGRYSERKELRKAPIFGLKAQERKLRNAEKELEGHDNKEAILKILKSGL